MHINLKFLHMTNVSPHISFVIFVTKVNLRIAHLRIGYLVGNPEVGNPEVDIIQLRLAILRVVL